MLDTVIVYHAKAESTPCFDGFCAAAIFWRKYRDTAEYVKGFYHITLPLDKFAGRDAIFVDFSYEVSVMDEIAKVARSLLVLDHHTPKSGSFSDRPYAIFNSVACGATMSWMYLFPEEPIPDMLQLIDDGDRYLEVLPDLDPFNAALAIEPETFQHWSNLIDTLRVGSSTYTKFIDRGRVLQLYEAKRIKDLLKESFPITLCGIKGLAVNSMKCYAHNAGNMLAKHSKTFGAVFYLRKDGNVEVSLRRVDPDTDVFAIADTFGGGGHKGAAGFSVSLVKFTELLDLGSPGKSDVYSRLDTVTKSFQHTLNAASDEAIANLEEQFLEHMQKELGANIADYIGFVITKSVSHPNLFVRFRSGCALRLGMPRVVQNPMWYHSLFGYKTRRDVQFDEDAIRNVLLESKAGDRAINSFFVQRLLETVNVVYPVELTTSTYYIHVTVDLPDSSLKIKHTFEVSK